MTDRSRLLVVWAPRVAGLLASLFLATFALDAFSEKQSVLASIPGFLIHLLPAFMLGATVWLAWNRPLVGALVFLTLAAVYILSTLRRIDWILAIAGPLTLVGALYLLSWRTSSGRSRA